MASHSSPSSCDMNCVSGGGAGEDGAVLGEAGRDSVVSRRRFREGPARSCRDSSEDDVPDTALTALANESLVMRLRLISMGLCGTVALKICRQSIDVTDDEL